MQRLQGKLPDDVSALLRLGAQHGAAAGGSFSEESLAKARNILNTMVFNSFAELDDVIVDCKAFERMNRGSFDQVVTDVARIGGELARAEKAIGEDTLEIGRQDAQFKEVSDNLGNEEESYLSTKAEDDKEMTLKKNDLAVFDFIMDITKCEDTGAFLQFGANDSAPVQVCETPGGVD